MMMTEKPNCKRRVHAPGIALGAGFLLALDWNLSMSLIVTKVSEALYAATATPPHSREGWATKEPIRLHQLCQELLAIGLHQVDVGGYRRSGSEVAPASDSLIIPE
jgi:hypothetical protein